MRRTLQVQKVTLSKPEGGGYLWLPWEEQEQKVQVACKGEMVGMREQLPSPWRGADSRG